jgi:integrase
VLDLGRDPLTGKRKQKWYSVKGTKPQAEKRLTELLAQHDLGALPDPGKLTVKDFLTRWIKDYAPNISPRGLDRYTGIISRHLIPALGNIRLAQLHPQHIQAHYTEKLKTLSPSTVRVHHAVLHKALDTAVRWGLVSRNASDAVTPPHPVHKDMLAWDERETRTFLESARSSSYYPLFYLALTTGMRRSEMLALRWLDCDLATGHVNISRTLHQTKDGQFHIEDTKTPASRRAIALPASTVAVLKSHKESVTALSLLLEIPLSEQGLIFSKPDGTPLRPNFVTRAWHDAVKKAGVKQIRLHDARHTHASLLLKQGVHPKIVQERLGHYSIQMTLDIYSHVMPGLQESAAAQFDEILGVG